MSKTELMLLMTPVVLFSLTLHEYSHGKIARILGDDTAERLGRLSFNPLKHLDPFGVLCFYFVGFGWAKPVPVDWRNFQNPLKDMMYVSLAGPVANILMASVCSFFIRFISPYENPMLFSVVCFGVFINVILCVFNMLPIYPLDGSSVLKGLVPRNVAIKIARLDRFGAMLLVGVLILDHFMHLGILNFIWIPTAFLINLMTQDMAPLLYQVLNMAFR